MAVTIGLTPLAPRTEFLQMLTAQANRISEREKKKTITDSHVKGAMKELGFESYLDACSPATAEGGEVCALPMPASSRSVSDRHACCFRNPLQAAGKKKRKLSKPSTSQYTHEELLRMQRELLGVKPPQAAASSRCLQWAFEPLL